MHPIVQQILSALAYYVGLITMTRLAGKRLAGQTTTFDLIVLISLGVVLQQLALEDGKANALVFLMTVFTCHRLLAEATAKWPRFRRLVRGGPRVLVRDGAPIPRALEREGLSMDDLTAGLRKLGYESPAAVRLAVLEETGHISAIET